MSFPQIYIYFFMFYERGSFFINDLSLTKTLYSGMENKLSLGFWYKKNLKELTCHLILAATVIGHFSGTFRIRFSFISAYSWRLKDNTLFPESKKPFVIYSLSIYSL